MKERDIFDAALAIENEGRRDAYLDQACGGNAALKEHLLGMLAAQDRLGSFLDSPVITPPTNAESQDVDETGGTIGPYKLLELIGEGGFGLVYMAEQTAPVRRKVALKIIKPGMDSRQVIARFEAERQALAMMDHPNIARVFDAGTTEAGRPYFAMELVQGVPITDYCDRQRLSPRQRLALFIDVCQAVQHAHQKGIIHRDLKPSNVMVTMHDDKPVPKIIDFGVAKALDHQLTEKTLFTGYGQMIGTPLYMSPEQAQFSGLDVDTRSDVYSLGVLLYELLTGATPFDETALKRGGFDEMRRMIREDEPLRPSARIDTLRADVLSTVADQRQIDPRTLSQTLRGEVDWIVMKALEKDRSRRYDSASSLAADLRRYLHDEPVQACPPSVLYRCRKFIRRHKLAVAVTALLTGVLLFAVVGLVVGNVLIWSANQETRLLAYFQQVALAEREWSANSFARADELIELCPPDLRGWEWHYVKRLRSGQTPPMRHDNMVWGCAVSRDGARILSSDFTGLVYCWDTASGAQVWTPFRAHEQHGGDVLFSPSGDRFATTGWDEVKMWDAANRHEILSWKAASGTIQGLAYRSDGNLLICVCSPAGADEETSFWDPVSGRRLFVVEGLQRLVQSIALSPDNRRIALACEDATVRIIDATTGQQESVLRGDAKFWCVSFSPDGRLVAGGTGYEGEKGSGTVRIWEVDSGRERPPLTGHGAKCLAFSPDGARLATGGIDQTVKLWDTRTGQEVLTLRGHTDWVRKIAFTPDGHRLISAGDDRTVRVWDGTPWREAESFGEQMVTLAGHTDSVNAVAFHPTEPQCVTASSDGTLKIWGAGSWSLQRTIPTELERINSAAFSPDGRYLAIVGTRSRFLTVLDAATGNRHVRLEVNAAGVPTCAAFSNRGDLIAVGDDEGQVSVFDVSSGARRHTLTTPRKFIGGVDFEVDGRLLAAASVDGSIHLWELPSEKEIDASPLITQGVVAAIAFSPDGKAMASVGWDRTLRIWATDSWEWKHVVLDANAATQCIAFSPDSELVAWGASDSTVKLLRRSTGELHTLRGHLGWVRGVAFSTDGKLLGSASEDGTAKIWTVPRDFNRDEASAGGTHAGRL